jgi:hypothetical protein
MTLAEPTRAHSLDDRLILVYDDLFTDEEVGNFANVVMQLDYRRRPSFDRELSAALDCDMFRAAPFLFPLPRRSTPKCAGPSRSAIRASA